MPLCSLHLLSLHPTTPNPLSTFLSILKSSNNKPLVISRVIRWIILPTQISTEHLLARNTHWDLFLILPSTDALPAQVSKLVQHHWHITAGVPSRLVQGFGEKNRGLLHPDASAVPELSSENGKGVQTTSSSQNLELSAGLEAWIESFVGAGGKEAKGAVSMFNLLAFKPGQKAEYLKYGAAFAKSIGSRHGGDAKVVGNVVTPSKPRDTEAEGGEKAQDASQDGWDEIALAHYPSILHFRDMLLSRDYQEVNHRYRVPSLRDTAILMTSEIGIEELVRGGGEAKL
ncbi:hypothetical protein EK21DRAFT_104653 [Setomelanomma holmii]|uniref:Uncharacterized protein n=1 Tax=Setomelanomma holmii TaxID=210430 RepID=A0A9P4GZS4_9PLEO|nr:hypothetical protein EK21DRAFT_104653 [Setomelanomma holmii]